MPMHVRQPCCFVESAEAVYELGEEYLLRDRDKLVVLLHDNGYRCLVSTVGRILQRLRALGA